MEREYGQTAITQKSNCLSKCEACNEQAFSLKLLGVVPIFWIRAWFSSVPLSKMAFNFSDYTILPLFRFSLIKETIQPIQAFAVVFH